jgi:large subunit ribosomal protein L25
VAGERVRLEVTTRDLRGSRASRRLRTQGLIPGVLYGRGNDPHAIVVPERDLRRALRGPGGLHTILDVVLVGADGGRAHPSVLKDYQVDPVRGGVTHVDLQEVRLDRPIQAQVVVQLVGDAAGASEGGVLSQPTRELNVEALPMEIPEHIDVDVTELHIGDALRLADLPPIEGVTFLDDPDETVLATVTQPTRVEEPEEVLEEGEEVAGVPEGEQAPEGGAEAPLEPDAGAAGSPGTVRG